MNESREHRQWLRKLVERDTDLVVRLDDPLWVIVIGQFVSASRLSEAVGISLEAKLSAMAFF